MILGDGAFGRCLGHKDWALWMELVPLQNWPEQSLSPFLRYEDTVRMTVYESGTVRNKYLLLSYLVYGIYVIGVLND